MKISDFITKDIVINNDYDGVLSGYVLKKSLGCNIVGWTNSKNKLYFKKSHTISGNETYIDIFTPGHKSVDQHILPYDYPNTLNPNILNQKFVFSNYTQKYPFSTALFIISELAKEGVNINHFITKKNFKIGGNDDYRYFDILLRADDTLFTSICKYQRNAKNWWDYLTHLSNNNKDLCELIKYIYSLDELTVTNWKNNVDKYFKELYGMIGEELPPFSKENYSKIKKFLSHFGLENDIENLMEINLSHKRTFVNNIEDFENIANQHDLFSYAFVFSPNNKEKKNFSYTIK